MVQILGILFTPLLLPAPAPIALLYAPYFAQLKMKNEIESIQFLIFNF